MFVSLSPPVVVLLRPQPFTRSVFSVALYGFGKPLPWPIQTMMFAPATAALTFAQVAFAEYTFTTVAPRAVAAVATSSAELR